VREYFIHNALYWTEEFHLDGLRLDAVHAILDDSQWHILDELAERVRAAAPDRHIHLVLENEENAAYRLARREDGTPRWFTAQWNDDVHHVLHVAASGDTQGYYADYVGDTEKLGRALAEGFAFQGEMMPYRGHKRGQPSAMLPPTAFVAFIQNHDQIGNRPFGDRLTAIAPPEAVRAVAAVSMLLPQVPMLFMGEEWGTEQPFPFFCDFGPELAEAVRNGRRAEFARFPDFQDPAKRERIPDPTAEETFAVAKLAWDDVLREPHAGWLDWYCRVLAARHAWIIPRAAGIRGGGRYEVIGNGAVVVRWSIDGSDEELTLAANLSARPLSGFPPADGQVLWREGEQDERGRFGPWSVRWSIQDRNRVGSQNELRNDDAGQADGGSPHPGRQARPAGQRTLERPASGATNGVALDRLAERMGIEAGFRDVRGGMVSTSAATKRALLAAMGQEAPDEARAEASLEALERDDWLRPLPPVQVVRADAGTPAVELVLPADTETVGWRLILEDGGRRHGRIAFGQLERIAVRDFDGRPLERRRLMLEAGLPWGYHRLTIEPSNAAMTVIVTPGRCWLPDQLERGGRLWGIAAQLYLLRSATNWGIGDFTDLRGLVELAASRGAAVIGLNPLHAMFLDNPGHASPYSPASRLLLNILNIDVMALPELEHSTAARELMESETFRHRLESCRAAHLVDYVAVTALKLPVLEALFEECHSATVRTRWRAFEEFRRERGAVLEQHCLFLALREHFAAQQPARADWHDWPAAYRHPASPAVTRFTEQHRHRLDFLAWLQWLADEQLGAAAGVAQKSMAIGLYRDLAIGADRSGAETWAAATGAAATGSNATGSNATAVVSGAHVGAPPDIGNPAGQDWGLPPFHPVELRNEAYRAFIELIRANMRHAGGLRIDHVMGLQHLYWVPEGKRPPDGAYVRYPMEDLIGILALESHRQKCLVVGEDLGTVPDGFRERMTDANILSYRVLFFEQDGASGVFVPPRDYPRPALAVTGSHDLPTLRGWWEGRDLAMRHDLRLFPRPEDAAEQRHQRQRDRGHLLEALRREGLLQGNEEPDGATLALAVHAYLARSPSMLAMAQIDDLTDECDPVNVPATTTEYPNWRRRLSMTLADLARLPRFNEIAEVFNNGRGGPRPKGNGEHG
jgi:4-alpha-glucanotransferase